MGLGAFGFLLLLLALLLGILLGLWLARRLHPAPAPLPPPPIPPPPNPACPPYKVPDQLGEDDLTTHLSVRLMGSPADGVPLAAQAAGASAQVVWVDHGNEVLVHLDSIAVRILDRMVLVSVDLETDQTGRTPLICSFAVSGAGELGGLIAATDQLPRGSGVLASSWGRQLQAAVWSSLMGLVNDHAAERSQTARALSASTGTLTLNAGGALTTGGAV